MRSDDPVAAPATASEAIETRRLTLVPSSPDRLLALIESKESFARVAGIELAEGLRELYVSGDISPAWLAELHAARGGSDPWLWGFFIAEREQALVVGTAGFKGPPDSEGIVEIAYGVAPSFQGRGYATEAAGALIGFARLARAKLIRAHTLPHRNASTRVLEKCGLSFVGEVVDPEDGPVWRWEMPA